MESGKKKFNGNPLYSALMKAWTDAYGGNKQQDYNAFWKANAPLKGATKEEQDIINSKIAELKLIFSKKKPTLLNFFQKMKDKASLPSTSLSLSPEPVTESQLLPTTVVVNEAENILKPVEIDLESPEIRRKKPAQDKMNEKLRVLNTRIAATTELKFNWAATDDQLDQLKKDIQERKNVLIKLKSIMQSSQRQKKHRLNKKKSWMKLKEQEPVVYSCASSVLRKREKAGRPSLNLSQPGLLQAIIDVVTHVSSADEFRQSEKMNAHLNLDSLHKQMEEKGFHLSRTALYLRLLPRKSNSTEGKRHVTTVPVRLLRPQNDARKYHADGHFCSGFIKYLKDLGEIMGEKTVFCISQDDKAKVPLGIVAANHQSPMVMHLEYRVSLPDHDFVVGARHKLTPSVYAGLDFNKDGKIGYSGPTYIAIRSGKHDGSSAISHAVDFEDLVKLEQFKKIACTESGSIKPIVIIFVDGGPDQNPRFENPMIQAAIRFKIHNLDAIFVATHAPGHSAYNQVERKMAPLSRDLTGVVLPYQHFGDHISMPDKTPQQIKEKLEVEKKNFQRAGEVLAEIWNGKIIDQYEVVAKYKTPNENTETSSKEFITPQWIDAHVLQSQYSLQIMKCDDIKCCSKPRSNIKNVIGGFLPAPVPFKKVNVGVIRCPQDDVKDGHFGNLSTRLMLKNLEPGIESLPFDFYCPTVKDDLKKRTCQKCSKYFAAIKVKTAHYNYCKFKKMQITANLEPGNSEEEEEIELIQVQDEPEPMDHEIEEEMEIIGMDNLGTYYGEIFEELDVNEAEAEILAESQMM